MSKLKKISLVIVLVVFSSALVLATNGWVLDGNTPVKLFGYNVYKFQGSGHYAIFYPLSNGSVKLLKAGKTGILPVLVKIPRESWLKEYSKHPTALKALPAPLVIFVNDKGIGFATLRGSKVTLKPLQIPNKPKTTGPKTCPSGYVPFGTEYCIPQNPTTNWIDIIASKTVIEPISFLGLEIDNQVLKNVYFDMCLFLSEGTYSYWTIGIDVGGVTVESVKLGEHFEGKVLSIKYYTPSSVSPNISTWLRYVNLFVKYEVVVFGVLSYDRYTGKFTRIPVTTTYPLEILSTGRYTIYETQNGTRCVEGNYSQLFAPKITSEPNYYKIPSSADITRKYINSGNGRRTIIEKVINSNWEFSSSSSISIPIGPAAVETLEEAGILSEYPLVSDELNALSLTLGFHEYSSEYSTLHYAINALPVRDCSVLFYNTTVRTQDYQHVGVPMLFITVTDGKSQEICNPHTGLCAESGGKNSDGK